MTCKNSDKILDSLIKESKFKTKDLPADFYSSLRRKILINSSSAYLAEKSSFPLFKHFVLGLVIATIFIFGFFIGYNHVSEKTNNISAQKIQPAAANITASAEISKGEPVTIKLVYDSDKDIEKVTFSIELPSKVSFVSNNPAIKVSKSISFEGKLLKGKNEIPFVVSSNDAGIWLIKATALYPDGIIHEQFIKISVSQNNSKSINLTGEGNNV